MLVGNKNGCSVHKEPDEKSVILYTFNYNEIINVYEEIVSTQGPTWNPIWFRCWSGYVFSGDLYEVAYHSNPLQTPLRQSGQLGEITVPYTRSMFYNYNRQWTPLWLYYYRSTHWVTDVITGPDGRPWYKIVDELGKTITAVRYEHVRLIPDEEFAPIHPDVPAGEKRIEISMSRQDLRAYEGDQLVFEDKISTGRLTTPGNFTIETKMPSKHMGNAELSSNIRERVWMGVPWTAFFEMVDGLAIHGTFWHSNYGTPMSSGCINMKTQSAKFIYLWSTPTGSPEEWTTIGWGTPVIIRN